MARNAKSAAGGWGQAQRDRGYKSFRGLAFGSATFGESVDLSGEFGLSVQWDRELGSGYSKVAFAGAKVLVSW